MPLHPVSNKAEKSRLTALEAQAALQQMENAVKPAEEKPRRMRVTYTDKPVLLETEEGAGRKVRQALQGRNLSSYGLAAIHPQFVHSSRNCVVYLVSLDTNKPVPIPAKIGRCRFIGGRVHEVAIRFNTPIDVRNFVRLNATDLRKYIAERQADKLETEIATSAKPTRASGSALIVEDFESSRQLYALWLSKLGLSVSQAATVDEAEKLLAEQPVNIILINAELGESDKGVQLARRLRARKLDTPIVCIVPPGADAMRAGLINLGRADVVIKPFEREDLEQVVVSMLKDDPYGPLHNSPIRSTLAEDKDALPLLEKFVDQVRSLADMLRVMVGNSDVAGAIKICQRLSEGGKGYGFVPVAEVAEAAVTTMTRDPRNLLCIRRELDRVIHVVNRLQC